MINGTFYSLDINTMNVKEVISDAIQKHSLHEVTKLKFCNKYCIIEIVIFDFRSLRIKFSDVNNQDLWYDFNDYYFLQYKKGYPENISNKDFLTIKDIFLFELGKINFKLINYMDSPFKGDFSFKQNYIELKLKLQYLNELNFIEDSDPNELKSAYRSYVRREFGCIESLELKLLEYNAYIPKVKDLNFPEMVKSIFIGYDLDVNNWNPKEYKFSISFMVSNNVVEIAPNGLRSIEWYVVLNNDKYVGIEYLKNNGLLTIDYNRIYGTFYSTKDKIIRSLNLFLKEIDLLKF